jgi:hypothetical protein
MAFASDFIFDIIPEPEAFCGSELAVPLAGAAVSLAGVVVLPAGLLLPLSLEAVESAFLPLHPESASDRYRPSVIATKRVRMIPSMSGCLSEN